jgi:aromatic ring-opening dioxygenase catalytic subunit (LigB family)
MPTLLAVLHKLEASLVDIPRQMGGKPQAVLVLTGHWEAPTFKVSSSARPTMIYDYSGFPAHTYEVVYPALGSPQLAQRVAELAGAAGIDMMQDPERGFDHGTFTPLAIMFPDADVSVVQVSLKLGYDPGEHWALGQALAPLRDEGVLVLGSGLSYHNLRQFGPEAVGASGTFDTWLQHTLVDSTVGDRQALLMHWDQTPAARQAHPREDHLVPLMVALGAAPDEPAVRVYHDTALFGGVTASSWRFGA